MDAGAVKDGAGAAVPVAGTPGRVNLKRGGYALVRPMRRSRYGRVVAEVQRMVGGNIEGTQAGQLLVIEGVVRTSVTALVSAQTPDGQALVYRKSRAVEFGEGGLLDSAVYDELDDADLAAIVSDAMRGMQLTEDQRGN